MLNTHINPQKTVLLEELTTKDLKERRGRKVVNEEPIPIVLLDLCISKSIS